MHGVKQFLVEQMAEIWKSSSTRVPKGMILQIRRLRGQLTSSMDFESSQYYPFMKTW